MSEETMENEVEANPLQDMIQHALDQNFNKANDVFNSMMTVKMSDLLDQEKINMADQIYNGVEPDEEEDGEQLELDLEAEDDAEEDQEWDDEEEPEDDSSEEEVDDEEEISSE
jgi:hypothetical protein